jgi:hypothetical protein
MKVTQQWLESKIKNLNDWLQNNGVRHFEYNQTKQKRDYYVMRLIELEENGLETIKI